MPYQQLITPLPVATEEATSCPICPLTEIWPCWPAGPFCPSSQKSGCLCTISPPHSHPPKSTCLLTALPTTPPGLLVSGVHPYHPCDPYKSRKQVKCWGPGKPSPRTPQGRGSLGEPGQCQWWGCGASGREATVQIAHRHSALMAPGRESQQSAQPGGVPGLSEP